MECLAGIEHSRCNSEGRRTGDTGPSWVHSTIRGEVQFEEWRKYLFSKLEVFMEEEMEVKLVEIKTRDKSLGENVRLV
jgi:hypothetical protein